MLASIPTSRLELAPLDPAVITALLDGAAESIGLSAPDGWPDAHDAGFLRSRREQQEADPSRAQWVRGVVVAADTPVRVLAGHAGFHGPPGVNGPGTAGALEVGYTISTAHCGRGYATEDVAAFIAWAAHVHDVRHFYASVAPDNAPSLAVIARLGFTRCGEQWDDEDGLELVFEPLTG